MSHNTQEGGAGYAGRRRCPRLHLRGKLVVAARGERHSATIENVSEGGLLLRGGPPLAVGEQVLLHVAPAGAVGLEVGAEVVHVAGVDRAGVRFLWEGEDDLARLLLRRYLRA